MVIVIPVFNDWQSVGLLLPALDAALEKRGFVGEVVLVDDGSVLPLAGESREQAYRHLASVDVLRLRRNLGHQRAIAVGLAHVQEAHTGYKAVVVMDGDGEDKAEDVPLLIDEMVRRGGEQVIFAERRKRLEKWTFQALYHLYRLLHWLLTGITVRVGNFSVLPPCALSRLVFVSELWNHYAAAVFRSRIPFAALPLARGKRLAGQSQMNFPGLVLHGLSAISVFSDVVGVRLLVFTILLICVSGVLLGVVVGIRFLTDLAVPGWATSAVGLLVVVLIQAVLLMLTLSFLTLANRSQVNIIPLRDARVFVEKVERLLGE